MRKTTMSYEKTRSALATAIVEYAFVVSPVAIYIGMEAAAHDSWRFLYQSPEWGIATMFLMFQALGFYLRKFLRSSGAFSLRAFSAYSLLTLIIVVVAAISSYMSLIAGYPSTGQVVLRLALLIVASIGFLILVGAASGHRLHRGEIKDDQ